MIEYGKFLSTLRKKRSLTQKQVAEHLGIQPKTVSKWETGHGFPDVSSLSLLAEILNISTDVLLHGHLEQNQEENGNMRTTKFFICPHCGSISQTTGNAAAFCCGRQLEPLLPAETDNFHHIEMTEMENDFYITFSHPMTKAHFISFIAYVSYDRTLLLKLYPEQEAAVRIPRMAKGKFYFYCTQHGLFSFQPAKKPASVKKRL